MSKDAKNALEAMEAGEPVAMPGPDFVKALAKVKALEPSQADISAALPEENAVEAVGVRGEKRIDYKGVRIKNASGDLNRAGKNLIDLHRPAAVAGADISQKLAAGDYAMKAQHTVDVERKHPLSEDVAMRCAKMNDLRPVPVSRGTFRGRSVTDECGVFNLWLDEFDKLCRIALVGTRETQRVEVYRV